MSNAFSNFLGGPFGSPGAPGFVPPTAMADIPQQMGQSIQTMVNRYNQLGLGGPGAAGGVQTPMGTAEAMDIGAAPSVAGGIPGQFAAVGGQLQNAALQQSPTGSGKGTSPASLIGSIGHLVGK